MNNLLRIWEEEFKKAYPYPKASLRLEWELSKRRFASLIDKEIARFKEGFKPLKTGEETYTLHN